MRPRALSLALSFLIMGLTGLGLYIPTLPDALTTLEAAGGRVADAAGMRPIEMVQRMAVDR